MTSTVSEETASERSWGAPLVMAGAMAAGLATGHSGRLALMAGIATVAGIKWMLRRKVTGSSRSSKASDFGIKNRHGREPNPRTEVSAVTGTESAGMYVIDDAVPVIWERGRNEPVSCGAVEGQTVWFDMPEPLVFVSDLPALSGANQLPESFFCQNPSAMLEPLPEVPAFAGRSGADLTGAFLKMVPPVGSHEVPVIDPLPMLEMNLENSGHEVVESPEMPSVDGSRGRLVMMSTVVVLVIAALVMVWGSQQQDGWVRGLGRHWQASDGGAQEQPVHDKAAWVMPRPEGK